MALKSYIRFGIQISVTVCVCANYRQIMRNRMSLTLPNEKSVTIKRVFSLSAASAHQLISSHRANTHTEREKHMLTIPQRRRYTHYQQQQRDEFNGGKKIYLLDFTFISIQYLIKQKPKERKKEECDVTEQSTHTQQQNSLRKRIRIPGKFSSLFCYF